MTLQEAVDRFGRAKDTSLKGGLIERARWLRSDDIVRDYEVIVDVLPEYEVQAVVGEDANWNGERVTLSHADMDNGFIVKAILKPNVLR